MATVKVSNVRKSFGSLEVIHGISVDIPDGSFVVLVGPSGCGKSTLLRMLAGLESITDGTISIGDRVVNDVPPKGRDIAMVFQNYALYPHMTVAENMGFSLRLRRAAAEEKAARVERAAEILGLGDLLERYPRELSGGQRQRVAMGRAIVRDPQVFLFDEPLSNLDASLRVQMRTEIRELHRRLETTTVYVTHDQIEAMTMADRIVVMRDGRVEQIGSPLDIYDSPKNRFVAGFIGSPSMNFFAATVRRNGADTWIEAGDGSIIRICGGNKRSQQLDHGRQVVCGIRPEHIRIEPSADRVSEEPALVGEVVATEPTGAETMIVVRWGDALINVMSKERSMYERGTRVDMIPNPTTINLFDVQSEARIDLT